MKIEEVLIKFGFEEKEMRVYLALLELGMEKVHVIAKKAKIKRSTAYVILEQLYSKNYVGKTFHEKKLYYTAEKPEILLTLMQQKQELLATALPLLHARMGNNKTRPKIKIYEGKEGVEQVYDEIYQSAASDFFGSMQNLSPEFVGLRDKLMKIIKSKDVNVRDLLTTNPTVLDFAKAAQGRNYEGRIVPKDLDLQIDGAIYDSKVAILSIKNDLFAVVIESKEVAATFASIFKVIWELSTPLEKKN